MMNWKSGKIRRAAVLGLLLAVLVTALVLWAARTAADRSAGGAGTEESAAADGASEDSAGNGSSGAAAASTGTEENSAADAVTDAADPAAAESLTASTAADTAASAADATDPAAATPTTDTTPATDDITTDTASTPDFLLGDTEGSPMINLAQIDGVILTADSTETDDFAPALAADGNAEDEDSRWSSANVPGSPEHWLCLEFPEEQKVAFLHLVWERLNVTAFVIEVSDDGASWTVCYEQTAAPETNEQTIILEETPACRYLRLRTTAVSESEENLFVYYQNVSLLELEVYAAVPMTYGLDDPVIEMLTDGSRTLRLPAVPEGYEIALAGADYEEVIGADGTVYPTLAEQTVEIGYVITRTEDGAAEESPAYEVVVPACPDASLAAVGLDAAALSGYSDAAALSRYDDDASLAADGIAASAVTMQNNDPPALSVAPAEWYGLSGQLTVTDDIEVTEIWAGEELGLGEEGYLLAITQDGITICAQEEQGLIWAKTTLQELLAAAMSGDVEAGSQTEAADAGTDALSNTSDGSTEDSGTAGSTAGTIPCGVIRDYPRYSIRGFSIDIGRRFVGIEMLEQIIDELASYRMNTLGVHLNDNEILTNSGLTGSVEEALTAYASFRLESAIENEEGESLTSSDGYLTDEEWLELVQYGAERGVEVVPEIDMPAHSLSLTRLFPELALTSSAESVDQLDLGNEAALELAEEVWEQYLVGEEALFSRNDVVHIGMDEYYGDAEEFRSFMARIIALAQESGHTVRMWGSLGRMAGATEVPAEGVQVQVWSWEWAEPEETYEAGYTVINSMNNALYLVPGGGYDRLDLEALADWEPNRFTSGAVTVELPAFSPRMAGAIYCLWNDNFALGLTDEELFERLAEPLPVLAEKLW